MADYDPYGAPIGIYNNSAVTSALGFTGEQTGASGLQYLRARYYDPRTAMFLSRDPSIGAYPTLSASWNGYGYAHGNPVMYSDPSGEIVPLIIGLGLLATTVVWHNEVQSNRAAGITGWDAFSIDNVNAVAVFEPLVMTSLGVASGGLINAAQLSGRAAFAANAVLDIGASYLWNEHVRGSYNFGDFALDAVFFGAGEIAGYGLERMLRNVQINVPNGAISRSVDCRVNSFSADTTVSTPNGDIPISQIEVGDEVLAYNELTGEIDTYTVTHTINHVDAIIIHLYINGELIETTPEHPFYTDDGVWIDAADLQPGEMILSLDGDYGVVESVVVIEDANQPMYNLTVDEAHTFFVGDGEWLVHNTCDLTHSLSNFDPSDTGDPDFVGPRMNFTARNNAVLKLYEPGSTTGFSGAYDPETNTFLARPSGDTLLASGGSPTNRVPRRGGHERVNSDFVSGTNVDSRNTWGFSLEYQNTDELTIGFISGMLNARHNRSLGIVGDPREAPPHIQALILQTVEEATGLRLVRRER